MPLFSHAVPQRLRVMCSLIEGLGRWREEREVNTTRLKLHIFPRMRTQSEHYAWWPKSCEAQALFKLCACLKEPASKWSASATCTYGATLHDTRTYNTEHTCDKVRSKGLTMLLRLGKRSAPRASENWGTVRCPVRPAVRCGDPRR